MLAWSEIDGLL